MSEEHKDLFSGPKHCIGVTAHFGGWVLVGYAPRINDLDLGWQKCWSSIVNLLCRSSIVDTPSPGTLHFLQLSNFKYIYCSSKRLYFQLYHVLNWSVFRSKSITVSSIIFPINKHLERREKLCGSRTRGDRLTQPRLFHTWNPQRNIFPNRRWRRHFNLSLTVHGWCQNFCSYFRIMSEEYKICMVFT